VCEGAHATITASASWWCFEQQETHTTQRITTIQIARQSLLPATPSTSTEFCIDARTTTEGAHPEAPGSVLRWLGPSVKVKASDQAHPNTTKTPTTVEDRSGRGERGCG